MSQYRIPQARLRSFLSRALAASFFTILLPLVASAQNRPPASTGPVPGTSYLAGMPSVDTVKRLIQGTSPDDTLARQVAALNLLPEIIQQMGFAANRRYGDTTSQEYAQMNLYAAASAQMMQDYSKSHTPDQVKALNTLHGKYEVDPSLRSEMFQKLFSSAFLAAYARANVLPGVADSRPKAPPTQTGKAAPSGPTGKTGGGAGSLGIFDPSNFNGSSSQTSAPTKDQARCLELGGSKGYCMGGAATQLMLTIAKAFGGDTKAPAAPHGPAINGDYKAANGMDLDFSVSSSTTAGTSPVVLSGCGKLISQVDKYTVALHGNGYLIQIATSPKPVLLTMNAAGQVVGSEAATTISGQVITGYNIVAQSKRYSDGEIVPGSASTEKVPVYGPAEATCSFGIFMPQAPVPVSKPSPAITNIFGGDDAFTAPPPTGVTMCGVYAAPGAGAPGATVPGGSPAGLRVEFSANRIILDCGQAHAMKPYNLQNSGSGLAIAIANDKPLSLALEPNGSLSGSGTVQVNGRLLVGEDAGGNFTFKPVSATCNVATLAPS